MNDNIKTVQHLLRKHGVLQSFHINKRISYEDMQHLYESLGIPDADRDHPDVIRSINETIETICEMERKSGKIPGVISAHNLAESAKTPEDKKLYELLKIVNLIINLIIAEELTVPDTKFVLGNVLHKLNIKID